MYQKRKISLKQRIRYAVDNFMARGGFSIFLALLSLFAAAFLFMSILRYGASVFFPEETVQGTTDQLWRVFLQISDAGAVAEDGDSSIINKVIGILTVFAGLVLFSSLVAFITSQFEQRIEALRKGKSTVIESNHTLILGFRERIVEIARELIIANESERDAAIVVLAEEDKETMDDFFSEHLEERKTTRIITRCGNTSSVEALRKMGVDSAKTIVILNAASSSSTSSEKSIADARVLKTIMAVVAAASKDGHPLPPIVAELHSARKRRLAESVEPGRITTMDEDGILSKLLVQTSRTSGLSIVYSNLVGFEGNEIYFFQPKGGWENLTFRDVQFRFNGCVPFGFRKKNGKILLNPDGSYLPEPTDHAIILAEDDSSIQFFPSQVSQPQDFPLPKKKIQVGKERHLIAGWNVKSPLIISEYAKYISPGSEIDIIVHEPEETIVTTFKSIQKQHNSHKLRLIVADIHSPEILKKIAPHKYNNVILLAGEGATAEEIDAESISILMQLRQFFRSEEKSTGNPVEAKIITEVMDSENIELVLQTGVKDFLISNQFVSKIFAQVSQEPQVMRVYDHLFSPEGSEIYLKKADVYFPLSPAEVSFSDCVHAAQKRGEVCFGIRLASEEREQEKNYGVYLIPKHDQKFSLTSNDELIVLSDDER
ncbi:CASTOR/POLLUX-related putative ion channel [Leptospira ognonensis]|nr:hypothetical protein [Leptospira ognonensis]